LKPLFPKSHEKPLVADKHVLSGIILIDRSGLGWRGAPAFYGPHKTYYSRWKRWSEKGILARMMVGLAAGHGEEKTVMIHQGERPVEVQFQAFLGCQFHGKSSTMRLIL
jgi:transposase